MAQYFGGVRFSVFVTMICAHILSVGHYGSTAVCWALAAFRFLNPIHSQYESLDGGSAHHKAATYTQNNTNIE
jgi:hypothetical protein